MKKLIKNFGAFMALCMFAALFAVCGFAYAGYNAEGDPEPSGGPYYHITVMFTEGGNVSRDPLLYDYEAGRSVTFYITPDEGFELVEFKVNDEDMLDKLVKDGNTYTFSFEIDKNMWISGIFQNPDYFEVAPEYYNSGKRWYAVNDNWEMISYRDYIQFSNQTNFFYGYPTITYYILAGDAENGYEAAAELAEENEGIGYFSLKLQPDGATILVDGKETLVPVMYLTDLQTGNEIKFLRAEDLGLEVNPPM